MKFSTGSKLMDSRLRGNDKWKNSFLLDDLKYSFRGNDNGSAYKDISNATRFS